MFKNSAGAYYPYDAADERMRRDFNDSYTEYQYLNGHVLAEKHSDGTWSDYIYANGHKIARADDYNRYIQFTGSFAATGNYGEFNLTPVLNLHSPKDILEILSSSVSTNGAPG